MGGLNPFSKPKFPEQAAPVQPPKQDDPAIAEARAAELAAAGKRKGRSATYLADLAAASADSGTVKKTLLGA